MSGGILVQLTRLLLDSRKQMLWSRLNTAQQSRGRGGQAAVVKHRAASPCKKKRLQLLTWIPQS